MTTPDSGRALADAELDRLEHLLAERVLPNDGMSLEILDGFLSALVVAPQAVPAEEYLREVWGKDPPAWASPAEQDEAIALIEGLRRHILWRVQREPDALGEAASPFMLLPPDADDEGAPEPADFAVGTGWAIGFLHGVSLRDAAWGERIAQADWVAEDLEAVLALAAVEDDEDGDGGSAAGHADVDAAPLDPEQRLDLIADVPAMLHDLHCLRIDELRPAPARRTAEPGRNDACPCGSGRKYKKCCGAAS